MNEKRECRADIISNMNNLFISIFIYSHPDIHKATRRSPNDLSRKGVVLELNYMFQTPETCLKEENSIKHHWECKKKNKKKKQLKC